MNLSRYFSLILCVCFDFLCSCGTTVRKNDIAFASKYEVPMMVHAAMCTVVGLTAKQSMHKTLSDALPQMRLSPETRAATLNVLDDAAECIATKLVRSLSSVQVAKPSYLQIQRTTQGIYSNLYD